MVAGESDDAPHRDRAGDGEDDEHPPRGCGRFPQHHHADQHGHERIDDRESGDDEVGRARTVGGLHEVRADGGGRDQREHADRGDPLELTGLDPLDHDLRERRDEAVEHAGADHVEECAHTVPQDQPARTEDDDDHEQQGEDHEELAVGHLLLRGVDRGEEDEEEDAADTAHDRGQRLPGRRMTRDAGVQQRGDDERDGTQWLHDDQGRLHEGGQLADDGETQHEGADEPGGPCEQPLDLVQGQTGGAVRAAETLDLLHAAVLVLRPEGHEHRTGEGERDAQQQARILEGADELIADILHRVHPHPSSHSTTLPADRRRLGL